MNTIQKDHSIARNLEDLMIRYINGESQVIIQTDLPPKPILPPKKLNITFLDIHPIEIARQLTIIEWNIYKSILPSECTGLAWSKKNAAERAPNVLAMINRFNVVRISRPFPFLYLPFLLFPLSYFSYYKNGENLFSRSLFKIQSSISSPEGIFVHFPFRFSCS